MTMPTNEDNARAIAARKGYEITRCKLMPENVYAYLAVDPVTKVAHGEAETWSELLRLLLTLPPLGDVQERIGDSLSALQAELERREDDDPRPAA